MRATDLSRTATALAIAILPVPASAASSDTKGPVQARRPDPNEVICEKQPVIGSRIATKRVCMTRNQWADHRSQDRQALEQAQLARGSKGE